VDILPRLLLPLAGPTPDTLDEEDIDKLPIDLQYLDEDKKIEEDADIRKLLLESLLQVKALLKARYRSCKDKFSNRNLSYVDEHILTFNQNC